MVRKLEVEDQKIHLIKTYYKTNHNKTIKSQKPNNLCFPLF